MNAVKLAFDKEFQYAFWFLLLSAIFDGLDGHAARALGTSSSFGAELDSLCDLVDFGVSPALVMFLWCRDETATCASKGSSDLYVFKNIIDKLLWFSILIYASCCACRLARFNLSNETIATPPPHSAIYKSKEFEISTGLQRDSLTVDSKSTDSEVFKFIKADGKEVSQIFSWSKSFAKWIDTFINKEKFFEGVPAPMGAFLALVPMMLTHAFPELECRKNKELFTSIWIIVVGGFMICTLRTFSTKMFIKENTKSEEKKRTSLFISKNMQTLAGRILVVSAVLAVLRSHPWFLLVSMAVVYTCSIPCSHALYCLLLRAANSDK
ncbi:uncharacterized protein LOC135145647 isoform X2 [Zophobas morio]|uniref:uncharacterized protein LOC135145647 isoform X2 n=1 Tax=Zophobas morio TaxID=2755281 RepID=UPI0030833480